jgi:hypothetical protein
MRNSGNISSSRNFAFRILRVYGIDPQPSTGVPVLPRTRTVESISQRVLGTAGLARRGAYASSPSGRLADAARSLGALPTKPVFHGH